MPAGLVYADDSSVAGRMMEMKIWWDILNQAGPKFGYYPKPSKTILIVKKEEHLAEAEKYFGGTGIKVTLTGERHLGAVIGTQEYRDEYVNNEIETWVADIEQLSAITEDEPQLAYSAYTKAMHRIRSGIVRGK